MIINEAYSNFIQKLVSVIEEWHLVNLKGRIVTVKSGLTVLSQQG